MLLLRLSCRFLALLFFFLLRLNLKIECCTEIIKAKEVKKTYFCSVRVGSFFQTCFALYLGGRLHQIFCLIAVTIMREIIAPVSEFQASYSLFIVLENASTGIALMSKFSHFVSVISELEPLIEAILSTSRVK